MNSIEERKNRVSRTDEILSKVIESLHLDDESEGKLFNAVYDHIDAVRKDVYSDAVEDTIELQLRQMVGLVEFARKMADELGE